MIKIGIMSLLAYILSNSSNSKLTTKNRNRRQQPTQPVELTMWVDQLYTPVGQFYQKRIDEFNEAYQDKIHVTLTGIPGPAYEVQVDAASKSGQLPDVILLDGPDVAKYVETGALTPMDEYADKDYLSDFLPSIIEQGTHKGNLYHLGSNEASVALYYNTRMLKQAGIRVPTKIEEAWTWDQLLENAKKLTKPTIYGLNMYTNYYDTEWFPFGFLPFVWSNGGDVISPDGSTVIGYLNGPKTVEAFDFIGEIFKEGVVNTSLRNTDFQNEKAAMQFDTLRLAANLKENYPTLEWGMMPYPVSPNTKIQVTPSGGFGYSISSNSKHPKEAFEVIKWMTNLQSNLEFYKISGEPPPTFSALNEIPEFKALPEKIIVDQLTTTARPRPKTPVYPELSEQFAEAFKAVAAGEDAQKVLDEAAKKVEAELKNRRQQPTQPIELTMWMHHTFSPEGQFYENRIAEFNEAYRNKIHVTLIGIPRPAYGVQVDAAAKSRQLPDLLTLDGPEVAYYAELGALAPMDEYADEAYLSDFLPSIIEQGTYNGHLYHLGSNEATVILYFNTRMLKQAGIPAPTKIEEAWTWDQLLENAKKLTKPQVYGLNMYTNYSDTSWFCFAFLPFVWSNGGDVISPDGSTVQGYLNAPKAVEAFNFFREVFQAGVVNTALRNTDFQNAKVAMLFSSPFLSSELKTNYPNLEWGMMPFPVSPNTKKQVTPSGSFGYSIASNSRHPREAFEVIKWLTNLESNLKYYEVNANPPATFSALNEIPEYKILPEKIIVDQLTTTARPRPKTPIFPVLCEQFAAAFKAVAADEDSQKALDEAAKNVEAELKK